MKSDLPNEEQNHKTTLQLTPRFPILQGWAGSLINLKQMAKIRNVNTKFWDDNYIMGLDPIQKFLYLYFLTNPLTNLCGAYEISLKRICFDTGVEEAVVRGFLQKFEMEQKITYKDGWLVIHNFMKNQTLNPKVLQGMNRIINEKGLPYWIHDRLSIDYDSLLHSNLTLTTLNSNLTSTDGTAVNQILTAFLKINPVKQYQNRTQRNAASWLIEQEGSLEAALEVVNYLVSVRTEQYCPVITTPLQLKNKYAQLQAYSERQKNGKK